MHFYHQYLSTYYLFLDERNCCWIRPFYSICSCSRPNSRRICCLCQSWQYHQFNVYNQFVLSSSTWYYLVSWLKGMYKILLQNLKKWCYTIVIFLLELTSCKKKLFFAQKKPLWFQFWSHFGNSATNLQTDFWLPYFSNFGTLWNCKESFFNVIWS